MRKLGFVRSLIKNWLPGYLFYCGLLVHFAAILMLLALAFKPSYRQELERAGQDALEPIENSHDCTEIFRGRQFAWENSQEFVLPPGKADRYSVFPTYRNLGLKGKTADGHDLFLVSVNLEIKNAKGFRAAVQPHGQTFFEVNSSDLIEACHVKMGEDPSFDLLLNSANHMEARWEPCERAGWYREMACYNGGRHCRPAGFCKEGKGVTR